MRSVVVVAVVTMLIALAPSSSHAAGAPSDGEARLVEAARLVETLGFKRARPIFAEVRAGSPAGSARWAQATFGQAVCAQHIMPLETSLIDEAARLFQEVIDQAAQSPCAASACLNLGRIAELDRRDSRQPGAHFVQARAHYQQVLRQWPTDVAASEAALRLAAVAVQEHCTAMAETATGNPDTVRAALTVLAEWIAAHPDDPQVAAHWHFLADCRLQVLGDEAGALQAYIAADARGLLTRGLEGQAWWRMAILAESTGQRDAAVRYYARIITDAPASGGAFEAQAALRRLGAPVPRSPLEDSFERAVRASEARK